MLKKAEVHVDARTLKAASLVPPNSKSDAQRALALAYALDLPDIARIDPNATLPADIRALERGLQALRKGDAGPVDVGDGGAPLRILLGQAAATPSAHLTIVGSKRLGERPHDALLLALRNTFDGLAIERVALDNGGFTLGVESPTKPAPTARFTVSAAESSQFATSLLLAAAGLARREQRDWEVVLDGPLASRGYLDLTLAWLQRAGVAYIQRDATTIVHPTVGAARSGPIPGDWSSISYLLIAAWKSGGTVQLVDAEAAHPDRAILDVLAQAGLTVDLGAETRVHGVATRGAEASGHVCPDLLPTIAALACVLPAPSILHAVDILRVKESDRLAGIEALVAAGGGTTTRQGDSLRIVPGKLPTHIVLSSRGDHRLAMSAATLAVLCGATLSLDDPHVVEKSFPDFWDQLARIGVTTTQ